MSQLSTSLVVVGQGNNTTYTRTYCRYSSSAIANVRTSNQSPAKALTSQLRDCTTSTPTRWIQTQSASLSQLPTPSLVILARAIKSASASTTLLVLRLHQIQDRTTRQLRLSPFSIRLPSRRTTSLLSTFRNRRVPTPSSLLSPTPSQNHHQPVRLRHRSRNPLHLPSQLLSQKQKQHYLQIVKTRVAHQGRTSTTENHHHHTLKVQVPLRAFSTSCRQPEEQRA